jgi:protein-disulfide isomerase
MTFKRVVEAVVSGMLVAAIVAIASVLAWRELRPSATVGSHRVVAPPVFLPEWRVGLAAAHATRAAPGVVELVEFIDLECPACRAYGPVLDSVRARYGGAVRVRFVPFPLPGHPFARAAASAAECAARLGDVDSFVRAALMAQERFSADGWLTLAHQAGVTDDARYQACVSDSTTAARVALGIATGRMFGVHATPTILVNGWRYAAPPDSSTLFTFIDSVLAGDVVPPDTPPVAGAQHPIRLRDGPTPLLVFDAAAPNRAPAWVTDATPLAVIGGAGQPEHDLTDARHFALLSDGHIAVLSSTPELRIYAPDGQGFVVIGRPGEGPGEWSGPRALVRTDGDTLLVPDGGTQRLSRVVVDKGVVSMVPLNGRIAPRETFAVGKPRGGPVIFASVGRVRDSTIGSRFRPPLPILALPATGVAESIGVVPGVELVEVATHYAGHPGHEAYGVGFGRQTYVAAWNDRIVVATNDGYAFDILDAAGAVLERIKVEGPARPVTEAMRDAERRRQLDDLANAPERPRDPSESRRLIVSLPFADSLPAYGGVFPSPDGLLWVSDPWVPGDSTWTALAFRADGALLRRLTVRGPGRPVAFGVDRVLLWSRDSGGAVSLGVWAIHPATETASSATSPRGVRMPM